MKLRSYLMSTSTSLISSALCLILASCGSESGNGHGGGASRSNTEPPIQPSDPHVDFRQQAPNAVVLAFNGFAGEPSIYQTNPLNLAGDLSVTQAENLYDYTIFKTNVGTKENPSGVVAKDYDRKLPKSGQTIKTGLTLLDPSLAMHNANNPDVMRPSANNPVMLSIPAGHSARPEAPFFPVGTRYSAVLVEAPSNPAETHGPILSFEAAASPLQFAAFTHQEGKNFTLRTYNNSSTLDTKGVRPLLTRATSNATTHQVDFAIIKSRFVSLTADNISDSNIRLDSMDRGTLQELGFSSGKDLLATIPSVFPRIYDATKKDTVFNENYGVFCLGGRNTFCLVNLDHQTFLYPQSAKDKNTKITQVSVQRSSSGIITESGKYVEIETLHCYNEENLKLITVMKDAAATADPIVKVGTLRNISGKINVVVGLVDPAFKFPATGVTLLSCDNGLAGITVNTEDAHMAGAFYDGETAIQGNNVVLTQLKRKASLSAGSSAARTLLAHDPNTQGLNSRAMNALVEKLDPMTVVQSNLGELSSALSQHALNITGAVNNSKHTSVKLNESLSISAGTSLKHMVSGLYLNHEFNGLNLTSSVYGVHSSATNDTGFGFGVTASKPMAFKSTLLVPSCAVGYDSFAFSGTSLHANDIHVSLQDALVNSAYIRAMTNLSYTSPEGVATTFGFGLEARNGSFGRGLASTAHTSVSMTGEPINGIYSIVEASFATQSSKVSVSLSNFNQFQIQFGLSD